MNLCDGTWLPQCEWMLLWPGVLLLGALVAGWAYWARQQLARFVHGGQFEQVLPQSVRVRRTIRDLLAFLGLALALFALAGPRFDKQLQIVRTSGTDLVLLLDLSRSMDARDVDPSRLERARREIRDLGRLITGDRVGLVVFAGGAYPRLPLTEDYTAVELVVSETDTESFQAQGSELGEAIREALELLDNHDDDQAGQALIVLSDGETHNSEDALAAAREAFDKNIPIYAMGIGIDRATIPTQDGRPLRYENEIVYTEPDFSTLQAVARETGGAFVQSNASDNDMEGLYREIRGSIESVARDMRQRETWREAFAWPLGIAILFLLVSGWLGEGRRRFGAATAVLLALGLASSSSALAGPLEDADALFREGSYERAADHLTELSLTNPNDVDVLQRLGAARYRAGDYEGAARAFEQAAELGGDPDARFNAGNAHYRAGRLERALQEYDRALQDSPNHLSAARNRQLVEQEILRRRDVQPPPPPKPKPNPGEDAKEQKEPPPNGQPPQEQEQDGEGDGEDQEGDEEQAGGEPPPDEGDPKPANESGDSEPKSQDRPDEPGTSDAIDPTSVQDPGDTEPNQEPSGDGGEIDPTGPITEGQAHRLLDSIEEGSQRVQIRGASGGKPW
ncbi:MAG: VWA domain-containing protein [Myxococcota bacterium]